jgi:hypothetical protein
MFYLLGTGRQVVNWGCTNHQWPLLSTLIYNPSDLYKKIDPAKP